MKASIFDEGHRFSFFQAVRILDRLYPDRERVGRTARPSQEVVRFGTRLSLVFPASEVHEVTPGDGERPQTRMVVNFLGLTGPLGVLPVPYTELLLERAAQKDHTLREFLDLFNHRLVSLFYRAWEKYRFPVYYEAGQEDTFSQYLADLVGLGTRGLSELLFIHPKAPLFFSGLLGQRPRSATALAGLLRDYFQSPVEVEQYTGRWVRLGSENETILGSRNSELGVNMICGARIWDRQSKFRVRFGPLGLGKFRSFLPSGAAFKPMNQLVRLFAGLELDFDVQLILRAEEVPACRLQSGAEEGPRLGWSSWLKVRSFDHDARDTVLACN